MELNQFDFIRTVILERLEANDAVSDSELIEWIEQDVLTRAQQLNVQQKQALIKKIFHSFRGYDVLQPLLDDPMVTEIMINRHDEIFYEKQGQSFLYDEAFESEQKLEDIIQSMIGKVNRVVNEATPIVDARLQDGSRINVVLPPIALKGPTMTIRKFPDKPLTITDLIQFGAITAEAAAFLEKLVQAKYNIFIGGGTGSGKTTFLNVLSHFIPAEERIITVEDTAELQIIHSPNIVQLETRNANTEGKGEITIRDLIRSSLRMRPNRIIVGEVRGEEALEMLQAMNTGHDGSLSTGHANSSHDMLSRLETMVLSGATLPLEVVRKQISSAIDIMVHLSRLRDRSRRIIEINEVLGIHDGEVQLNPLFQFEEEEEAEDGHIIGKLQATGNELRQIEKLRLTGIKVG